VESDSSFRGRPNGFMSPSDGGQDDEFIFEGSKNIETSMNHIYLGGAFF